MKINLLLLAFFIGAISSTNAQEHIKFNIKNAGISVEGSFSAFKSKVAYDKHNPGSSSFSTEIQVKSISTGVTMRDSHLKKEDFFDLAKYSTIKFVSTSVSTVSANTLKIAGNLTIKNVTKPIILTVKISEKDGKTTFTTSTTLNRNTYNVGGSSWTMADELTVNIKATQ